MPGFPVISDDEARALWRRAAEMQVSAEHRKDTAALMPTADLESGLSVEQVTAAAEGAGIDPEYVRLALAERSLPEAASGSREAWAPVLRVLTNDESDALERSAAIAAPPERVLAAVRATLARPPYDLTLENTLGEAPLEDGVLVYRIVKGLHKKFGVSQSYSPFQQQANNADGRVLLVTIRADPEGARLSVRMPLFRRGQNMLFFSICAVAGALAGSALPPDSAGLLQGLLGAAGLVGGTAFYRGVYRWALRKGETAIERLLRDVSSEAARTEGP
jgi:hypothetical protein